MNLSLRTRLVAGMILLVSAGLVVASYANYKLLEDNLRASTDADLLNLSPSAVGYLLGGHDGGRGIPPNQFAVGTYLSVYSPDSKLLVGGTVAVSNSGPTQDAPVVPLPLHSGGPDVPVFLDATGAGSIKHYRVLVESLDRYQGVFLVLAVPTDHNQRILSDLLTHEAQVGLGVLLAIAAGGFWLIRQSLRPLDRMGDTAAAIAAGDLSRRVQDASPGTEVGRLGAALNAMLEQIEAAFAERTRSEQRLRQFLADASHELRTPLTSIRGYAEMLRRGAERSPEDAIVARRRIEQESVRMSGLVEDLLLLARLDQGRPLEMGPVRLDVIAADACADIAVGANGRRVQLDSPLPVTVTGDESRLRQVVGNLVRNAVVHTPAGTPIEVSVGAANGAALFTVADHGPGLDAEKAARVFEPFYRADAGRSRDSGGVGLGLSIVKAVVTAHNGTVRVAPTRGGGATFTVELPVQPPAPNGAAR